jgi:hypothetical protein
MQTAVQRRDPEIRWYFPIWCHHHGSKMRVENFNKCNHFLVIAGSAASVRITRKSTTVDEGWFVEWEVVQSQQAKVSGRVFFTSDDLRAAFGLSQESGEFGDWLIEQFGADSASQGKFIRWKNFLNIPCPGTGHDGDPNVSIHIDEDIQNAVRQLLE